MNAGLERNVEDLNRKGEALYHRGLLQEALEVFQMAIRMDPEDVQAYNNAGVLYWRLGCPQESLRCLTAAFERNRSHRDTVLNLAEVLESLEHWETLRLIGETYLTTHPEDDEIHERVIRAACRMDKRFSDQEHPLIYTLLHGGFGNNLYQIAFTLKQSMRFHIPIPIVTVKPGDVHQVKIPQNLIYLANPTKDLSEFGGHLCASHPPNLPGSISGIFPKLRVIDEKEGVNRLLSKAQVLPEKAPLSDKQPDFFLDYMRLISRETSGGPFLNHGSYFHLSNFYDALDRIRDVLAPSPSIMQYIHERYGDLINARGTKVGLHLRYGYHRDNFLYQTVKSAAIREIIHSYGEDTLFVLCSDNIARAREDFGDMGSGLFFIQDEPMFIDFFLLTLMDDHVITMSTFSAWTALFRGEPNKNVYCPADFIRIHGKGSIPPGWRLY